MPMNPKDTRTESEKTPAATPIDPTTKATSQPGPAAPYPENRSADATARDPKRVGKNEQDGADRIADRAAHKGIRDEQEHDKANSIFTH